ncbi:MAG: hypothetical protein JWM09_483 [Francisellaceae bacterium]|nr:hypothetical protein [Francisellaceae bacterium]
MPKKDSKKVYEKKMANMLLQPQLAPLEMPNFNEDLAVVSNADSVLNNEVKAEHELSKKLNDSMKNISQIEKKNYNQKNPDEEIKKMQADYAAQFEKMHAERIEREIEARKKIEEAQKGRILEEAARQNIERLAAEELAKQKAEHAKEVAAAQEIAERESNARAEAERKSLIEEAARQKIEQLAAEELARQKADHAKEIAAALEVAERESKARAEAERARILEARAPRDDATNINHETREAKLARLERESKINPSKLGAYFIAFRGK